MLEKYQFLVEHGISEMICAKLGDYILVYGGNNFPEGTPPEGKKKLYQEMYLFDLDFNLIWQKKGKIFANAGLSVVDENKVWYILDQTIYLIELDGQDIKETEFASLDFSIDGGFATKYENSLIFGYEKLYKFSLKDKSIEELGDFPGLPRKQSVYYSYQNYLYIFGGASNICHLDGYKYDLKNNQWQRLADIPVSLTGSCYQLYDEHRLIIMGGFNKEVYDEAVQNLSDIEYKKAYFKRKREDYKWNRNYYVYDFEQEEFSKLGEDPESATCGAGLIKVDDIFYLVGGELQPGIRNPYIYKTKLVLE